MDRSSSMRENLKKLALWDTRTFSPIITHDELDAIMATRGFISHQPYASATATHLAWKEYVYYAEAVKSNSKSEAQAQAQAQAQALLSPRPRLPYPRIDGLHIYTYRAFIDAVNFYLEMGDISDLFHVRGMPLHHINDRNRRWALMQEDDGGVFIYREGTLDQATENFYNSKQQNSNESNWMVIRERSNHASVGCIVPLKLDS